VIRRAAPAAGLSGLLLLFLLSGPASPALASTRTPPESTLPEEAPAEAGFVPGLLAELAVADDPGYLGLRLGLHAAGETGSLTLGVGLLGAELHEDLMMEGFLSLRRHLFPMRRQWLVPFAGLGVTLAAAGESFPAEEDDVDNDNDGAVDEDGEESSRITDLFAGLTPEVGLLIQPRANLSFCPLFRYYLKSTGLDDSQWVFALGLHFNF